MSQIALTADFHWGVPGRLRDIHWAARVIRAYCQHKDIDTVWVLGDLLHDRAAVGLEVLNTLYDFLAETRSLGQSWYTFPGNHDMYLKHSWALNGLRPLRDQLNLLEDVRLAVMDDRRFFVLPFIHLENSYMKVLRQLERHCRDGDILLTHIGVRGATLNTCFLLKDWSCVNFDDTPFYRVYTGHFHSRQSLNRVYYPGSPIPFKFDEGDVPHGFYVLDLETMRHQFVDIWKWGAHLLPQETPPPQYLTVLYEQLSGLDQSLVHNNMIRVAHQHDLPQDLREQLRQQLLQRGCRAVRWLALRQEVTPTGVPPVGVRPVVHPGELFEWWMQQDDSGTAGLDKNLLRKFNAVVQHEGDERYVYTESD